MRRTTTRLAMLAAIAISQVAYVAQAAESLPKVDRKTVSNQFWWPDRLDLSPLRQHNVTSSPADQKFDYALSFKKLNFEAVKKDIENLLSDSQDWWPADYGTYAPFFVRMAWHSAGSYRLEHRSN